MRTAAAAATAAALAATVALGAAPRPATAAPVFRDRVITSATAVSAQWRAAGMETGYRTQDGQVVLVQVSPSVSAGPAIPQEIVNFLGTRLHGLELGRLRVFIGTPEEIRTACGGDARILACYATGERRMYIPDRDPQAGNQVGFTRDYAVTHEYGHHIAAFRSNSPWPALDWGAKRWSSYKFVCAGVEAKRYFPGDQAEHYLDDPGEGFADTYAHLHYPNVPWQYNEGMRPDAGAYQAVRRDVLNPWRRARRKILRGSLNAGRTRRSVSFDLTLDGDVNLRLRGPRRANYDILLYADGEFVERTRARGSRDRLSMELCREDAQVARIEVRVVRRSGEGRFTLAASYPG